MAEMNYKCKLCEEWHDNVHSDQAHGLCPKCREAGLEMTRASLVCCRCEAEVVPFTAHAAPSEDRNRFLLCPSCGLVLTRKADDHVRSIVDRAYEEGR